jgi:hypothetical protein
VGLDFIFKFLKIYAIHHCMEIVMHTKGRCFLARITAGKDLIETVETFCREVSIQTGVFCASGVLSSYTIGAYDPKQQVYVTFSEQAPREMVVCSGTLCMKDGSLSASAHVVLADDQGRTSGGRLFSPSLVFGGDLRVEEWIGPPMERIYETNGLMCIKKVCG